MSLTPLYIVGYDRNSGYEADKKPHVLPDQAFPLLENAYVFRERVKKRELNQLLGRLRRIIQNVPIGLVTFTLPSPNTLNLFTLLTITEVHAEIEIGSVIIVIGAQTLTDNGDGTFIVTGAGNITSATINYITSIVTINFSAGFGPVAPTVSLNYFPSLPVMGIWTRDLSTVNDEQTVFFDTTYAYINTGSGFQEWIPGTTWAGTDSDFFLATNYRGVDASDRLFFITNFVNDANNPMRYSNGSSLTTFAPVIGGKEEQESIGTVITPWVTFTGSLTHLPITKGTVVITAGDITFTDEQKDGTLQGLPPTNTGTINYTTGVFVLNFNPALTEDTTVSAQYIAESDFLFQARILIPYYGRLLALNTFEGPTIGSSTNIYNRCRFSQIGNPVQIDAWRSDIFGKGGFIDAPTAETIIGATFFKNTLIVFFERSTWQLRYVGEYGLPFIWERISSDYGSESTFSAVLFDDGILAVGDKAIITSNATNVQRIDEKIPDLVFTFRNKNNGIQRVIGIRNFQKELVFWCYSDSNNQQVGQYFPNKVLLANYRNKTFAILRDNITFFGTFQPPQGVTWDSLDAAWDSQQLFWEDVDTQSDFPFIVCGNAEGFINYYLGGPDGGTVQNSKSLSITGINLSVTPITLTVNNHNLQTGDLIYIQGMLFLGANSVPVPANVITFNGAIFQITFVDLNTISLSQWDIADNQYIENFAFAPNATATYIGGGQITLLPKMTIQTKDFNPYTDKGSQLKLSYVDLLTDATPDSSVTINLYINSAINHSANVLVGNTELETNLQAPTFPQGLTSDYYWHRFFATAAGQYVRIEITYDDGLMNMVDTNNSDFILNAMRIWVRPGARTILG